jgi:ethanolamine ammonia-lyase small subunit
MHSPEVIKKQIIQEDPWVLLRSFTAARIALGRTGTAVPLKETLNFKLAHAQARDAVYSVLQVDELITSLRLFQLPVYLLHSNAGSRLEYLQRPDKGRQLNNHSIIQLEEERGTNYDVAFILADGLSATAINHHALPLLELLIPALQSVHINIGPISIVQQARVAIADEIGALFNAKLSVIFIGERPGLSSSDSLGAYITFGPRIGLTDDSRNCISNIRPDGLACQIAAEKLMYLIQESMRLKISGISLKDNTGLLS